MTFNRQIISVLCLLIFPFMGFGQNLNFPKIKVGNDSIYIIEMKIVDGVIYDVDDRPLMKMLQKDGMKAYFPPPIDAFGSGNIEFDGGEKAFNSFRDSVYHHYWIKEYRETEINSSTKYVILFNSDMKIISVYILLDFYGRDDYDNGKLKFGDLLKKVMYATEGHWHKKDSSDKFEYYYKIGTFRFY